jgi:hypothetical protein
MDSTTTPAVWACTCRAMRWAEQDERGHWLEDDDFLLLCNAHHEEIPFVLPILRDPMLFEVLLDTALPHGQPTEGFLSIPPKNRIRRKAARWCCCGIGAWNSSQALQFCIWNAKFQGHDSPIYSSHPGAGSATGGAGISRRPHFNLPAAVLFVAGYRVLIAPVAPNIPARHRPFFSPTFPNSLGLQPSQLL